MFKDMFSDKNKNVNAINNLDADIFGKMIAEDENCVLIDVRTPMENKTSRIPNSLLINISDPSFIPELDKLDRDKNYYLYCRSGNRSYHAGIQMLKMGFKNVSHLQPGIIGWKGNTEQDSI